MARGLARLVELESANNKRLASKLLRARAGKYSTEYEWVRNSYKLAEEKEKEANQIEKNNY